MIALPIYGRDGRISPPQMLILISVRNARKYGYEIIKDIKNLFEGVWEPKTGAIYPAIKKLQDGGYLISETVKDKEYYSLSDDGRKLLMEVLPKFGAMAPISSRFMALIEQIMGEFGLEAGSLDDVREPTKEEKLKRLMKMRTRLESGLTRVNEAIESIAGE